MYHTLGIHQDADLMVDMANVATVHNRLTSVLQTIFSEQKSKEIAARLVKTLEATNKSPANNGGQTENVSNTTRGRSEVFKFKKKSQTVRIAARRRVGGALEKSSKTTFTRIARAAAERTYNSNKSFLTAKGGRRYAYVQRM